MRKIGLITLGIVVLIIVLGAAWFGMLRQTPIVEHVVEVMKGASLEVDDQGVAPRKVSESARAVVPPDSATKIIRAADIQGVAAEFKFTSSIPVGWQVEAVPAIDSINVFDPDVVDDNTLAKSQIFIRSFTATSFLTLSTVDILGTRDLTISGRPAVEYDIAKKSAVAPFPSQPAWRNERHIVTDIRVSDSGSSVFYVIAKRPDLDNEIYQQFLSDLQVTSQTSLIDPTAEYRTRITKKPFGIFVSPESSPIQPERFTGYHTGVDVEYEDVVGQVEVRAIADGTVLTAQHASGYGGVIVISHSINGQDVTALYGHLDPASLLSGGSRVASGQTVGVLGAGGTTATDGERKHLHLSIHQGSSPDLRGYVDAESELVEWSDPLNI